MICAAPADVTAQSWRDCMAINLDAAFFAAQAAADLMTQRNGGSIINFGSLTHCLDINMLIADAKASIIGLAALARTMAPTVFALTLFCPGG